MTNHSNPVIRQLVHKNVLVTGGGGFIGSWLSRFLAANGARVTILVRKECKSRALNCGNVDPSVNIVQGKVEDAEFIDNVLNKVQFDVVFHLASTNDNRGLVEPASRVLDTNILGTWNLLSGAQKFLSPRSVIVLASSAELSRLKTPGERQLADNATLVYPYHVAKKCAETIGEMFFDQYGLKLASVRLPNVFGGGDQNLSRIVPSIISDLLEGKTPELRTSNNSARRYIYVEDVVDSLLTVVGHLSSDRVDSCCFGFSPRPALTTTALLNMIMEEFCGEPIENTGHQVSLDLTEGEGLGLIPTLESIGWREKIGVRRGLAKVIAWYRESGAVDRERSGW